MDLNRKSTTLSFYAKQGKIDELMDFAYDNGGDTDLFIWLNIARDYGHSYAGELIEKIVEGDVLSKTDLTSLFFELAYWYGSGKNVEKSKTISDEYMKCADRINTSSSYRTIKPENKEIISYGNKIQKTGKKIIKNY